MSYAVIARTPAAPSAAIVNDGFLPDIDVADFRAKQRVRDSVTPERAREALIAAMITVGRDLRDWVSARRIDGLLSLAAVDAPSIDGISVLEHGYRRAVYCYAKADLVERYRDTDTTQPGIRKLADTDDAPEELRRDAVHAIRDILGVGRTAVELI